MEGLTPSLLAFMLLPNLPPLLPSPQLNILMLDMPKAVWASFSSLSTLPIQGSLFTSLILMLLTYQWNLNYSSSDLYICVIISIKPPASNLTWPKGNVQPPSSTPNLSLSEILYSLICSILSQIGRDYSWFFFFHLNWTVGTRLPELDSISDSQTVFEQIRGRC